MKWKYLMPQIIQNNEISRRQSIDKSHLGIVRYPISTINTVFVVKRVLHTGAIIYPLILLHFPKLGTYSNENEIDSSWHNCRFPLCIFVISAQQQSNMDSIRIGSRWYQMYQKLSNIKWITVCINGKTDSEHSIQNEVCTFFLMDKMGVKGLLLLHSHSKHYMVNTEIQKL